uniref:Carbohydrate sulfotransferase n=1 Tax=Vespula pensylvanica TaxID=30213 RepID=A0A834P1H8_VESPE|nr:hypothetical protein H0235_008940 [Vespula pensylvanica]
MSLKLQFIKCIFCVILYLLTCLLFLQLKAKLNLIKHIYIEENNKIKEIDLSSTMFPYNKKSVNSNIKLSRCDRVKLESNYQQENGLLLKQISNTCIKYNLKTPLVKKHFLYSPKHKSLYCWIRKVASTSFTTLFSNIQEHRNMNSLTPHSSKELQHLTNDSNIFKLLVVRHPFERLVSSYRDRIEDNTKYTDQAWIYTKKIYHFTRPNLFRSNKTTGSFFQKIFTRDKRLQIVPTFKEFIEWLLQESPKHDDVHWDQYYTHCALCNINYSFILKLDYYTFDQINYIFSKFGIDKNNMDLPNLEQSKGGCTDFKLTCKYFQNLTHNTILKLHERYKIDFEMYNYDLDKYLLCKSEITKI